MDSIHGDLGKLLGSDFIPVILPSAAISSPSGGTVAEHILDGDKHLTPTQSEKIEAAATHTALSNEVQARVAGDDQNAQAITNERLRAQTAEQALRDGIEDEADRAETAENTLQANIDAEASVRSEADARLQANLDAEKNRAQAAQDALTSNLATEINERQSADTAEEAARRNADNDIQAQIDSINGQTRRFFLNFQAVFGTDTPTKAQTDAWLAARTPIAVTPNVGTAFKNSNRTQPTYNHLFVYYTDPNNANALILSDDGVDTVSTASASSLGIVRGAGDISVDANGDLFVNAGTGTDTVIGNRTLADETASATLISIAAKSLMAWLQGIRNNLKWLFENKISGVQRNGTTITPDANKIVNIAVPTNTNELENGANYATAEWVRMLFDELNSFLYYWDTYDYDRLDLSVFPRGVHLIGNTDDWEYGGTSHGILISTGGSGLFIATGSGVDGKMVLRPYVNNLWGDWYAPLTGDEFYSTFDYAADSTLFPAYQPKRLHEYLQSVRNNLKWLFENNGMAAMPAKTIKGNAGDVSAHPTDLTIQQVKSMLNINDTIESVEWNYADIDPTSFQPGVYSIINNVDWDYGGTSYAILITNGIEGMLIANGQFAGAMVSRTYQDGWGQWTGYLTHDDWWVSFADRAANPSLLQANYIRSFSEHVQLIRDNLKWLFSNNPRYFITFNNTTAWTGTGAPYTYVINASTHGKGLNPVVQVMRTNDNAVTFESLSPVDCTVIVGNNGNVTLKTNTRFAGRVIIM